MATNTTHLSDFLTSASMSCLALSNMSVRHLLVYGAGAGPLQFSKPQISFSMWHAGKPLDVIISVFRYIFLDRTFVFIHHCHAEKSKGSGVFSRSTVHRDLPELHTRSPHFPHRATVIHLLIPPSSLVPLFIERPGRSSIARVERGYR